MKYSIISMICLIVLTALLISAAFAQESPQTITFWYSLDEEQGAEIEKLIGEFNLENKNMKIEGTGYISEEALKQALFNNPSHPDVALIDNRWQSELIDKDLLVPVIKYMDAIGSSIRIMYKADTHKPVYNSCFQDDTLWTLAFSCNNNALIVNLDLLYSLNKTQSPQGWFDIVTVGKAMKQSAEGRMGIAFPTDEDPENLGALFVTLVRQKGGNLLDEEGKIIINNEQGVATLQFLNDLYNKYQIASLDVTTGGFFVGQVGMIYGDSHDYFRALELGMNVEAVYCPKKDGRASDLYVTSLALFKSDEEKEKAAFKFLHWLTEYEQIRDLYLSTSFVPSNKQVVASPQYFEYMNAHPGMRVYLKQLEWAKPVPNFPYYDEIMEYLGTSILKTIRGEQTPQEALNDVADYGNGLLGVDSPVTVPPVETTP